MGGVGQFLQSFVGTIGRSLDLSGRAPRRELAAYWLCASGLSAGAELGVQLAGMATGWSSLALEILPCLPLVALAVRRVHDAGRAGWWALIVVPLLLTSMANRWQALMHPDRPWPAGGWANLGGFVILAAFVSLMIAPGTPGDNRYGPDPRA